MAPMRSLARTTQSSTVWVAALSVAAFVVLAGSASQSRLEASATVAANARSTYDILVRPAGSRSALEERTGRVRANALSGIHGGITRAQLAEVRAVPGVAVAAPLAMLGQVMQVARMRVDVTDLVAAQSASMVRFSSEFRGSGGLRSWPGQLGYVYVADGVELDKGAVQLNPVQRVHGRSVVVCDTYSTEATSPFAIDARWSPQCYDRQRGYAGEAWPGAPGRFYATVEVPVPVVLAAVDPAAEDALTGLGSAITTGRPLTESDRDTTTGRQGFATRSVPVVVSARSDVSETTTITVARLPAAAAQAVQTGLSRAGARDLVDASTATSARSLTVSSQQALDTWLMGPGGGSVYPQMLFQASTPTFRGSPSASTGALAVQPVAADPAVWRSAAYVGSAFAPVSPTAQDASFRTITPVPAVSGQTIPELSVVGTFDPARIAADTGLGRVPMETYERPSATATDAMTRRLLGADALYPSANPGGYLQVPPLMLTSLAAIDPLVSPESFQWPDGNRLQQAPISAIRVRVAGVTGVDPVSRERVRLAADQVRQRTGLPVDIVTGSSPTAVRLQLPLGGQTELHLAESWVSKGVAVRVTQAIDAKSLALFLLVLLSAGMSSAVTANAEIRGRRHELGILSALGWRPRTLRRRVLAEAARSGVVAGMLGAVVAVPIGLLVGAPVTVARAVLAVPAAVIVVVLASLWPAVIASRSTPAQTMAPPVTARARTVRLRGLSTLVWVSAARSPARVMTAAISLALGVAALVILLGVTTAFRAVVVGSLLGNAVVVQVRSADLVAAVILLALALVCVVQVLRLDLREQRPQYAALSASGWRDRTLALLVLGHGALVGALGAALGLFVALATLALIGIDVRPVIPAALLIAGSAVGAAAVAAVATARPLTRLSTARILAEE